MHIVATKHHRKMLGNALVFILLVVPLVHGCSHTFDQIPARIKVRGWPRHHEVVLQGCVTPKEMLADVEEIEIKHRNNLTVIDVGAFQNLEELRNLHLDHNGIERLEADAFLNLPKLHTLSLRGNRLREIPEGVFNHLPLRRLYLSGNRIERISPRAFDNMPNLEVVYLDNNLLTEWSPEWFQHSPHMRTIYINNNHLTRIPDHVLRNFNQAEKTVRKVAAFNNQIREIGPNAFTDVRRIDTLLLHNNQISTMEVASPVEINVLVLQHNNVRCLPDSFLQNVRIRHRLHLVNNPLEGRCLEMLRHKAANERFGLAFNKFMSDEYTAESD